MIRTLCTTSVAALALAAGANAAVMQLDINGIQIRTGGEFTGVNHTGTLTITKATTGTLVDILVDGASQGGAILGDVSGEVDLVNGQVVGGFLTVIDGNGARYDAGIGQAGRVNTQAGRGFRIDGLTFAGVFSAPASDEASFIQFGNVDVGAIFGARAFDESLEGSFLITSFNPDANGIDTQADIDVFIVPTPGAMALAGLAGIAVLRRKR